MVSLLCRNSITHVAKKNFCMRFFMRGERKNLVKIWRRLMKRTTSTPIMLDINSLIKWAGKVCIKKLTLQALGISLETDSSACRVSTRISLETDSSAWRVSFLIHEDLCVVKQIMKD